MLSAWRYAEMYKYTKFIDVDDSKVKAQYFGIVLKMDKNTAVALQAMVMGLTVTEWMAKFREEVLSFDLITNMSVDFFFAYDVIEILMMSTETDIYKSNWIYITFFFAFVAMIKYIPMQPCEQAESPRGLVIYILVGIFCCDVPFVVIRVITMVKFGFFTVALIIHPLKNVALILFGSVQLYIIYINYKQTQSVDGNCKRISQKRQSRTFSELGQSIISTHRILRRNLSDGAQALEQRKNRGRQAQSWAYSNRADFVEEETDIESNVDDKTKSERHSTGT
ncbi:DgyrCDS6949 [Dimorphilus gyrociliatus]|uniref:DgyrCDS6949 n=1 Tax=Dimorphilus gyrociliatus TaxID=2664684 RepID=A0A7I8VUG9_9ANNE|nr:DgyrCDS6949 [Dimorphilus gyrociliatus]